MKKNEKGQILVLVIIVFAVVLILGTSLLSVTTFSLSNSRSYVNKKQANNIVKSTLDIITHYMNTNPSEASALLPSGLGIENTSSDINFTDANNQSWNSKVTIKNIGSDQYKVTAVVKGNGNNSSIIESMSVIIEGQSVPILGDMTTESIDISGSALNLRNGKVFSNNEININNIPSSANDIKLSGVAALGGISMNGNGCELKIDEIYSEGNVTIGNGNTFKAGSQIKDLKLKAGNTFTQPAFGYGLTIVNPVDNDATMPAWVADIQSAGPTVPSDLATYTPYSENVLFYNDLNPKPGYTNLGPMIPGVAYKINMIQAGKEVRIENQSGGEIQLSIYNPGGKVIFKNNGASGAPFSGPITFKGNIIAKEIVFENNIDITFDLNTSGGGGSTYNAINVLYYQK